jgi:hypothetical protein
MWYLFNQCPGAHKSWTLAVSCVSKADALEYIKANYPGMVCIGKCAPGIIRADCGAVTEKQRIVNRAELGL